MDILHGYIQSVKRSGGELPLLYGEQVQQQAALLEQARQFGTVPFMRGPHYDVFRNQLRATSDRLYVHNPTLPVEILQPPVYQSPETFMMYNQRSEHERNALEHISQDHLRKLRNIGTASLLPHLERQYIEPDLLGRPPMAQMGETVKNLTSSLLCFNACYRMMYGAVTGSRLDEGAVATAVQQVHNTLVAFDESYLNVFRLPQFTEQVLRVVQFMGADLSFIRRYAKKCQTTGENIKLFSILSLESEVSRKGAWHTNVLVGARDPDVLVFDPRPAYHETEPKGQVAIPKAEFAQRWAATQNRGYLLIVRDPKKEAPLTEEEPQLSGKQPF